MVDSSHSVARPWRRPSDPAVAVLDVTEESERATESKMRALGIAAMLFPMIAIVAFVPPPLAGRILDACGNAVKLAEVRAIAPQRTGYVLIARTNGEGAFKFATFP